MNNNTKVIVCNAEYNNVEGTIECCTTVEGMDCYKARICISKGIVYN